MTFTKYLERLNQLKRVSESKEIMLKLLWGNSTELTPTWVLRSLLSEQSDNSYADRRLRELRDEHGCALKSKSSGSSSAWCLMTEELRAGPLLRQTFSSQVKKQVLSLYDRVCANCGVRAEIGRGGLEFDHRKPVMRGGGNSVDNAQLLCWACNGSKMRQCRKCEEKCDTCPLAFPEKSPNRFLVVLPASLITAMNLEKKETQETVSLLTENAIKIWLKDHR